MADFCGHPVASLENEKIRIEYLADVGPRLARLFIGNSENLFAELPGQTLDGPNGRFEFMGGHRLWHSPESLALTYIPDQAVTVTQFPDGVRLQAAIEPGSGLAKSMQIRLEGPTLTIDHAMENCGGQPIRFAPWALSMLRLGGKVILPQPTPLEGEAAMLPNRKLVLWSYTQINDPRLQLGDDFVMLDAKPGVPAAKIGYFNTAGWAAYWLGNCVLVKRFEADNTADYPDGGCNMEVYCNDKFVELETLAPLATLAAGQTAHLCETWEIIEDLPSGLSLAAVVEKIATHIA